MDGKQLSITLRTSARKLGLCDEWYNAWSESSTQQELINKYLRGIDFALANNWPSNDFIKENFDKDLLLKNGILVNGVYSFLNPRTCVVLGDSQAKIRLNGNTISVIYVRGTSDVDVIVHTNEKVIIHTFDSATVMVKYGKEYTPDVLVLNHSSATLVDAPKEVRYKEDFDYLK